MAHVRRFAEQKEAYRQTGNHDNTNCLCIPTNQHPPSCCNRSVTFSLIHSTLITRHHSVMIHVQSLIVASLVVTTTAFVLLPPKPEYSSRLTMSTMSVSNQVIIDAMRKNSKTLAVALEYAPIEVASPSQLQTLSMQLRQCKASALVTSELLAAIEFAKEQGSAQGNFPGPCPVIYTGDNVCAAAQGGVTAIVVKAGVDVATRDVAVIRRVESVDEVAKVSGGDAFLVDADLPDVEVILGSIPSGSVVIAAVHAMQGGNAEVERAKELKGMGVTSILLRKACVGDCEDIEYSIFAIEGLTKKRSSTFNMTGLTGSTNGHFGGVASTQATTWLRAKRS